MTVRMLQLLVKDDVRTGTSFSGLTQEEKR